MRAGKLDRTIVIQIPTTTVDDYGTPVETWATLATIRAEMLQSTAKEWQRDYGASSETAIIFRVRYLANVALPCRIVHNGETYDLKETKEIGRRRVLELRCIRIGPQ